MTNEEVEVTEEHGDDRSVPAGRTRRESVGGFRSVGARGESHFDSQADESEQRWRRGDAPRSRNGQQGVRVVRLGWTS